MHLTVLITGLTGVGKSDLPVHLRMRLACGSLGALLPRSASDRGSGARQRRVAQACAVPCARKVDPIVFDDFALAPLSGANCRAPLEILDDRCDGKSTLITSQLPIEQGHAYLGDPALADAILRRLVRNAYQLALDGDSIHLGVPGRLIPDSTANLLGIRSRQNSRCHRRSA
jgi:hypothetical protein